MQNKSQSYLTFRVRQEWYAISVDSVIEVIHMVALNEVPEVGVLGMMTLRKRPVKVIDLRLLFGASKADYKLDTPIIAINTDHGAIGLVVDEPEGVTQVKTDDITPYDEEYIDGVFRCHERMVFIVKTNRLGKPQTS